MEEKVKEINAKKKVKENKKEKAVAPKVEKKVKVSPIARAVVSEKPVSKISFDVYFSIAMRQRKGIRSHHKAPMKIFFEKYIGGLEATRKEFDEILAKY